MMTKGRKGTFKLIVVFLLCLLFVPSTVSASDWEQFQGDIHNTGVTEDKAPITYPVGNEYSWATKAISADGYLGFDSAFIALDGVLYVVGCDHNLRALYMGNGTEIWSTNTGEGFHLGSIAAGNDSIFVSTYTSWLYCINSTTGVVEWKADERLYVGEVNKNYQMNTPVVYDDHKVYFGGWLSDVTYENYSRYYCYYDNGTKCWERQTTTDSGYYWTGAAVIDDYLVYADIGGYLVSVYKNTGLTRDQLDLSLTYGFDSGNVYSSICYAEELGRIYLTSKGGYLYSIGMNSDGTFDTVDKQYAKLPSTSKSTPAYYNGKVYFGTGSVFGGAGSGLLCYNASNVSEKLWSYSNATAIQSSPVISTAYDDGDGEIYIYFTTNVANGTVYCINGSGIEQWTYTAPSEINEYTLQGVTISDGWLFYGNDARYVFGMATKESLGKVHYIDNSSSLQDEIYDAENGDTIMLSPGIYNVSLDPLTGYSSLYINKSDLIFEADGGEVIIVPDTDACPSLMFGVADADDTAGCDASGTTFKGINFAGFDMIGTANNDLKSNQVLSNLRFETCTFSDVDIHYIHNDSYVMNCTFSDGPDLMICGDNIIIEGNNGTFKGMELSTDLSGASDLTIRNNSFSLDGSLDLSDVSYLMEGNIIHAVSSGIQCQINNSASFILNNDFTNISLLSLGGQVYLNNIIDCNDMEFVLASGTFNTSDPVNYTYKDTNYASYLGNYYSDYSGTDVNDDGIGDDPVTDSSNGGIDYYPLTGKWISSTSEIEAPVADFSANITSGNAPLTVQFTDMTSATLSWDWDLDNDGVIDSTDQNPVFTYTTAGRYSVNLTIHGSTASDSELKVDYIYVADDWNPWNDAGSVSGSYISIDEVIEAYNCWRYDNTASYTGYSVSIDDVISMYNAWRYNDQM
ncbi:outer membrane protein assembly factor BamB family protein [Methanolobus profundi]|uniref:Outer membrane protein assembly factor BamB, contains PQQ-like beta-propeller repeat n=1 Tax=Methanolobus profundi TaxID=487685 RepID=A0A1I4PFH8_9EURY|nr:PQQ-binding-like beta-propeller repeat protein [Methanolobus profundi]SFM26437.1 Outer membrane protein assembly factor BamB, contains PQQ-like beta-propeller repeat [Methanolobus profundi]